MLRHRRGDYYIPDFDRGAPASVSEVEESMSIMPKMRRVTGDSFTSISSASETSETESLSGPPEDKPQETGEGMATVEEKPQEAEQNTQPPSRTVEEPLLPAAEIVADPSEPKSDVESDSTIGAARGDGLLSDEASVSPQQVCFSRLLPPFWLTEYV